MKKTLILLVGLGLTLFIGACEQKKSSKDVAEEVNEDRLEKKSDRNDAEFVTDAMGNSYDGVKMADDAIVKATNPQVISLATDIRDEHKNIITELKATASVLSYSVPDSGSSATARTVKNLSDEKGLDYDRKWLKEMEDLHEKEARKYDDAAKNCSDSTLRNWAGIKLVKIREHLDMIKKSRDNVK